MTLTSHSVLTIAVAGATGNAGKEIVRALASRGHRVRALVRNAQRLGNTAQYCAEIREVQVTDSVSLRGSLDGVDMVFTALGKTRQKDRVARRTVDVDANLNLLKEAQNARVRKFGLLSVAFASLDHPVAMVRMKGEVEEALRKSGLPSVIVQPSGFFSDMWEVFCMCRSGTLWTAGDGKLRFNPISLVDLASFVSDSLLDDAQVNKTLPIGGPEAFDSFGLASVCGRVLNRPIKVRRIPLGLAQLAVRALQPFSRNLYELGDFFVGTIAFGASRDNNAIVPSFGTHRLEDYLRQRHENESSGH